MKYLGSKRSIAKAITSILKKNRKPGQLYVEPFVGGANTFELMENPKIGGELNKYQYKLLKALASGWLPPLVDEEMYDRIHAYYDKGWGKHEWSKGKTAWRMKPLSDKNSYSDELIGFAGIALSFKGKWWGGYSRDNSGTRSYAQEALNNVTKLANKIKGSKFYNTSYDELDIPAESLIYCDPPYGETTKYSPKETGSFDSTRFWEWCRTMIKAGHTVFVSEYNAPNDFVPVWTKSMKGTGVAQGKESTEKLFVHKSQRQTILLERIVRWDNFVVD